MLEILPRGVAVAALQLVAVGEGERMHDEIERAPFFADHVEHAIDAVQILDVDLLDDLGADRLGQRNGAAAECAALIAEGKLGALPVQARGRCPRRSIGRWRRPSPSPASPPSAVQVLQYLSSVPSCLLCLKLTTVPRHRPQPSNRRKTRVALVPPKPKLFDITGIQSQRRPARLRTIGMSATSGSKFSILADSQMKPLFIISSE